MYSYIIGKVVEQNASSVVIDKNDIGYLIYVANPYSFEVNEIYKVYLYQQIKEDEHLLFGFKEKEERDLFLKLIDVKGVGSKTALPILATGSVGGIVDAIQRENILYLKKFPKIGEKVARQIVLDLKDKLKEFSNLELKLDSKDEVREVLKALGYKDREIISVIPKLDREMKVEEQVKEALKILLK